MELNILHLYPDCMSLYGEYANVTVLRRLLELAGAAVTVKSCTLDDGPDFESADLIYMGAGTERTQKAVMTALAPHGDGLKGALERGAVVLFTGNAMEVLGRSVTDMGGKVWPGLGLAEFATVETAKRDPEDVVACSALLDGPVVGFMNKCSKTTGVDSPLFDGLKLGFGNEADKGPEGYADGNLLATHITGPLLVKNPHAAHLVMEKLFDSKGWGKPEVWPVLPHQREAYEVTVKELSSRAGA